MSVWRTRPPIHDATPTCQHQWETVYREVRERIDIFNKGGGFVCNAVHNVQGNSPIENVLAMFRAIKDSAK